MSRITRKELKTDRFALEVGHTVTFFEEHRKQFLRYGGIALGVLVLLAGYWLYARQQRSVREQALARAIQVQEALVETTPTPGVSMKFPTQEAKDQEALKAFSGIVAQYGGSDEADIAQYYLGSIQADQGKLAEAVKSFQQVVDHGDAKYSSLAKLSLAQIYFADGHADQGEKMLRDLIAHPSIFVSSEQATITLARQLAAKNPAEARKLLDPLRSRSGAVGQTALAAIAELPPQ